MQIRNNEKMNTELGLSSEQIDIKDLTLMACNKWILGTGEWLQRAIKGDNEEFIIKFVNNLPIAKRKLPSEVRSLGYSSIRLSDGVHIALFLPSYGGKAFFINVLSLQITTYELPRSYGGNHVMLFALPGCKVLFRDTHSYEHYRVYDASVIGTALSYENRYIFDSKRYYAYNANDRIAVMGDRFFSVVAHADNAVVECKLENDTLIYVNFHNLHSQESAPRGYFKAIYDIVVIDNYLISFHYICSIRQETTFDSVKIHKIHLDRLELVEDISQDKISKEIIKKDNCLNPYVSEDGTIHLTESVSVVSGILEENWRAKQKVILNNMSEFKNDSGQDCFPSGVNKLVLSYLFAPSSFSSGGNAVGVASTATAASASTGVASTAFAASAPSMVTTAPTAEIETRKGNKRQYSAI
jgi:hypothetical protein